MVAPRALSFAPARVRRRPNLTPMIDVVFLLLVFFMLASRFGVDQALPITLGGGTGAAYSGPPRLVDLRADGLSLNGTPVRPEALAEALASLMQSPDDTVILRPGSGSTVQDLVTVVATLRAAGMTQLVVVE